jgi:UDP-N-acetylmuramate dehydrogenase
MNWWKELKGKIRLSEPLKNHTSFKIGGRAKFFVEPKDTADLKLLLNLVKKHKVPVFVIGAGSNILISDRGVNGLVTRLNSPFFKKVSLKNNCLEAGSGTELSRLLLFAYQHGLSGLEFLAGIPGTLGGALAMNAGIPEENIADAVEKVTVMDYNGRIKILNKKNIKFSYRQSSLAKYIILSTQIKLRKKKKKEIREKIKQYLDFRKPRQDYSFPSAGCVFKNAGSYSAGRLIDLCGLKGRRIGNAQISLKHANFILNLGGARASDVSQLMHLIRKKVKDKFNIILEPEIKIWP